MLQVGLPKFLEESDFKGYSEEYRFTKKEDCLF